MPFNNNDLQNQELSAEFLLANYFPDVKEWTAKYGSFFSRNYSGDLMLVNEGTKTVSLSRNGLYDILPEKMFFDVEELRFLEHRDLTFKLSVLYDEEKNNKAYFQPFDSFYFNRSLDLHKAVTHACDEKTSLLLKLLFDYDIHQEENPYVKLMAPLLVHVCELRGRVEKLARILSEILECSVEARYLNQSEVTFIVHKAHLNSKEYRDFSDLLKPLFEFVKFWFIPMEMDCEYRVKDYSQPFVLSQEHALVLDYNTQL